MATTGSTTTYQYPYPLGGDSLSNVATRIKELADKMETTNLTYSLGITPNISDDSTKVATTEFVQNIAQNFVLGTLPVDSIVDAQVNAAAGIQYSKLDLSTYPGHYVCTSSTRPTGIAEGHMIYETDTQRFLVYDGTSSWDSIFDTDIWSIDGDAISGISSTASQPRITLTNVTSDANTSSIRFQKSRAGGTLNNNDNIGDIIWNSHDGASYFNAARIRSISDGASSVGSVPTGLTFSTVLSGTTSLVERLRIANNGFITITGAIGRGAPVTKTADFTVGVAENWLINNKAVSSCTVTLPTASSWTGREIMIKNLAAFTVVSASSNVKPSSSDTAGTAILPATAGTWCTLVSDGTNWIVMQSGLGL